MGRRTHQYTARASGAGARLRRERRGSVAIEACAPVAFVLPRPRVAREAEVWSLRTSVTKHDV